MKHIYTFGTILLLCCSLSAQNAMFVCFEKCSTYENLEARFTSDPWVKVLEQNEDKDLSLQVNGFDFRYDFNEGNLFKITMLKDFKKAKQATEAISGCLRYFDLIQAQKVEDVALANTHNYVFVKGSKVFKFHITQQSKNKFVLELSSKYVPHTPLYAMDPYCELLNDGQALSLQK